LWKIFATISRNGTDSSVFEKSIFTGVNAHDEPHTIRTTNLYASSVAIAAIWQLLTYGNCLKMEKQKEPGRMKSSSSKMTRITISVDPEDYQALEKLAQKEDRSAAWMIRKAMREFLLSQGDKQKTGAKQ
jgi:Ribbon-helix-helix protein, copG family